MTPGDLRQAYLDFFANKNHAILPSASLVSENDPTTLFTGSGMQPLLPYFLGQPHPKGSRVVNSQKCFRSQDIEEVGDNRHTTFFEMLGNWSFGDYFKQEQLAWIFEFFTDVCGLDPKKLYVTVYEGNQDLDIPRDEEAAEIWKKLFAKKNITDKRVFYYGNENWWSRVGEPTNMPDGEPGGPDSEIFYDFGVELKDHENSQFADQKCHLNCECGCYLEIGNSVFMTYVKTKHGFEELENKNIDFGGGFERILAIMNNDPDIFKTELFAEAIKTLEVLRKAGDSYENNPKPYRIIVDHLRASIFLVGDGVRPSNKGAGYVLRRLIRRAMVQSRKLGIAQDEWLSNISPLLITHYLQTYEYLNEKSPEIYKIITAEVDKFRKTIKGGIKALKKIFGKAIGGIDPDNLPLGMKLENNIIRVDGGEVFRIYETYGLSPEISQEIMTDWGLAFDEQTMKECEEAMDKHRELSRSSSTGMFKGGLGENSEITTKYHTATHLLHSALRQILGQHVQQKGSNITGERLRFDFSHPQALTKEEINQVETQINNWIESDLSVAKKTMDKQEALDAGAIAFFIEKYPDQVTIYTIGQDLENDWISKEFCGGPHVDKTGEIDRVVFFKEQSCGAGIRRAYIRFEQK